MNITLHPTNLNECDTFKELIELIKTDKKISQRVMVKAIELSIKIVGKKANKEKISETALSILSKAHMNALTSYEIWLTSMLKTFFIKDNLYGKND